MVNILDPDDEDEIDSEGEWDGRTEYIDEEVDGEVSSGCRYWGQELEIYD